MCSSETSRTLFYYVVPFVGILCLRWFRLRSHGVRFPAGPPQIPILGNIHQVPNEYQYYQFTDWARTYGSIFYVRFLTRNVFVVNSSRAAQVLMEKCGAKYSGRPPCTYVCDLGGFEWNIGFMTYGDRWKRHRKWFQQSFQSKQRLESYVPIQQRERVRLLTDLLREPVAYAAHVKRYAAGVMLDIAYGHSVSAVNDARIQRIDEAIGGILGTGNPGSMLVDFFPILKHIPAWMPGAGWKRTALRLRPEIDVMNLKPFREVVREMRAGTAKPSFAATMLDEVPDGQPLSASEEREMSGAAGVVYSAGTETTVCVIMTFILAMILYPEVYEAVHAEIDRVVGCDRLPELDDKLPYLRCVLQEVYRWGVPIPLSVAHQITEDDTMHGYTHPRGTVVIPNLWAMSRDVTVYENPDEFNPRRYFGISPEQHPGDYVFGHGRRICPGRALGDSSAWLAVSGIAACFDIRKARDSEGREISPSPDFMPGFVRCPKPFVCDIRPRSKRHAELVSRLQHV